MKVAITGATGLVGSALATYLKQLGHEPIRLVRRNPIGTDVLWNPADGTVDTTKLAGVDAVVHLAGENIAEGRWTPEKKERMRSSRVRGTQILSDALAKMPNPPATLVAASAIGYYGNRGTEVCTESSQPGDDYLAKLCVDWERAVQPAHDAGLRIVQPRIGVVLATAGGALKKMLLPFRLGAGGKVGSGQQYMSWIALSDLVRMLTAAVEQPAWSGPINAVAPHPVTNLEFTKALGKALGRPTIFPMPAFVARVAFGEMADALLLSSTRVVPERATSLGFRFDYPELLDALRAILAGKAQPGLAKVGR